MNRFRIKPAQVIIIGFFLLIVLGGILLTLPIATVARQPLPFLDALFTSCSAVCVTGLTVVEVGTVFSMFGQIVILCLIQIGGLGFMAVASLIYMVIGKRITLRERMVLQESLNQSKLSGIVRTTRKTLTITLVIELVGAAILAIRFVPMFGWGRGIYYGIFHSISAFCNAGFDVLGRGNSLQSFVNDPIVNFTIMGLIILGGLGFFVILDLLHLSERKEHARLSTHSKMALLGTGILLLLGFVGFTVMEWNNPETLGQPGMSAGDKMMAGMFESVTTRTAGYATIDQAAMTPVSKMLADILMFIGASPAGTGGGIKTTTFLMVLLMLWAIIRGQEDIVVFKKRMVKTLALRAMALTMIAAGFVLVATIAMYLFEGDRRLGEELVFESISAFGTVGLSQNLTPSLSAGSHIVLIIEMYAGRVGLLTLTMSIANQLANMRNKARYPEDKIIIG